MTDVDELADVVDELADRVDELARENQELEERVADLEERNAELARENAELEKRCRCLEEENDELEERVAELARENAELKKRARSLENDLTELEDSSLTHRKTLQRQVYELKGLLEDETPTLEAEESGSAPAYEPESPLEQLVALPSNVADRELTRNEQRARFVARDVREYARKVPAGWALEPAALRRVLEAWDGSGHNETVRRVRDLLDELGGEYVDVVERSGRKLLVFADDVVPKLEKAKDARHTVVTSEET